tara:strand:- start:1536 stop:2723 length:1188 start_codon:yes stop_codon:yes gene_type:complete
MYYDRVLSTEETLYISRAQQKIAELTVALAQEYAINDVDPYKAELALELEYSINVLKSTTLDWEYEDIRMMMDYYSTRGELVNFAFRTISFQPVNAIPGGYVWATVPQLREVESDSQDYDAYLLSLILQEAIDRADYDAYLLGLINVATGGATTIELTASETIGGIYAGTVFPIGSNLEDIWNQLFEVPASVSNFTFDNYAEFFEIGVGLGISVGDITFDNFTWDVIGVPVNLKIDGPGFTAQAVSGSSFGTAVTTPAIAGPLTWTLSGDNIEPVSITITGVYASYYAKEATATDALVTVTEAKVLAGDPYIVNTVDSILITPNTASTEQGFIAVPKAQTVSSYTKWYVNTSNFSNIETGEFIVTPVDVVVSGITYQIYRWGYRSPLTDPLTLHR